MNEISRKPAHTVAELASARQHQENSADYHLERAVKGKGFFCLSSTGKSPPKAEDRRPAVGNFEFVPWGGVHAMMMMMMMMVNYMMMMMMMMN